MGEYIPTKGTLVPRLWNQTYDSEGLLNSTGDVGTMDWLVHRGG